MIKEELFTTKKVTNTEKLHYEDFGVAIRMLQNKRILYQKDTLKKKK